MTYAATDLLTVYLNAGERRKMGRLALRERKILFEYDPVFLASGIELSPFKLPLKAGVFTSPDSIFDGLYGVFNDSLPDGWGRLLLERTVEKYGVRRGQLNVLDRLAYVGRSGMGALSYEPDRSRGLTESAPLALDRLAFSPPLPLENLSRAESAPTAAPSLAGFNGLAVHVRSQDFITLPQQVNKVSTVAASCVQNPHSRNDVAL